jgi:hypothetical protein
MKVTWGGSDLGRGLGPYMGAASIALECLPTQRMLRNSDSCFGIEGQRAVRKPAKKKKSKKAKKAKT